MRRTLFVILILFPILSFGARPTVDENRVIYLATGAFDDFRDDISDAIIERGMVISGVSRVGEMLGRTGKDLGDAKPLFHRAEILEFCSAIISRRAMAADPHNIVYCPYKIAVYSLPEAPEQVYMAYPRLRASGEKESPAALQAVEEMLRSIIEGVLE